MRNMLLEHLEQRQLLAVGPQLIGIQPNNSDLIVDGSVRNQAPRELTFRFDDAQRIDPQTLDGIRITRSGSDGSFGLATVSSDFGSLGGVDIQLTSTAVGQSRLVQVSATNLGAGVAPVFSSNGNTLSITLNSNPVTPTTAQGLVAAINSSPVAVELLRARINGGLGSTVLGTRSTGYSPLRLEATGDEVILPGQIVVGDNPDENEVTVRFGSDATERPVSLGNLWLR